MNSMKPPLPPELQALADVAGLDPCSGLRQCGNRAGMYQHMLRRFTELYTEPLQPPSAPHAEADLALRDAAHSLRGASATVGAVGVQALAGELERLCDGPAADELRRPRAWAALNAALEQLVQELLRRLPRPDASTLR